MDGEYLSCDWGTSSFRLRWIKGAEVIREHRDAHGCRSLFDQAAAEGKERSDVYASFIRSVLDTWDGPRAKLPLVISGMASSTIGWRELPYAGLPLKLDASNLRFETLDWHAPEWIAATYLISGAASATDIMRGEETEAIGLLSGREKGNVVLVLPGTHSKHLRIENDRIQGIATYMTGELFEVLARHSILKATVEAACLQAPEQPTHRAAFNAGVQKAVESSLSASLFQARTRGVLQRCSTPENTWFLSGVLIGAELADLLGRLNGARLILGGAPGLRQVYAHAVQIIAPSAALHELPDAALDTAVTTGHRLFLQANTEWKS